MANEITKLGGDGGVKATLLFLYPIAVPITYNDANSQPVPVVPTPSSTLPVIASNILTLAEKASLDAGTLAFELVSLPVVDAMTNPELLVAARALYVKKKADYLARLDRAFNRVGQRFDEV